MINLALIYSMALTVVLTTQAAHAELTIPNSENYESGRFLCEQKFASLLTTENGFYTTVPVDYKNPAAGTTDVYAFYYGGFDPTKETILYFTGGPGLTAHWGLFSNDMPYNTLIMDNRGIACSRPPLVSQYLDAKFYSSEFVARDAKLVIEKAKLKKVTVYGISYGTETATIFASLFPDVTRALILEGTMVSGDGRLFEAPHRRKLIQKMLDQLPQDIQSKVERVHSEFGVPNTWLSRAARNMMMSDEGIEHLKEELLSFSDEKSYQDRISDYKDLYVESAVVPNLLFLSNDLPYYMISCQELSLAKSGVSTEDVLVKNKLVASSDNQAQAVCAKLGATSDRTYDAAKYPVNVPVTYFQGSDDGATASPGAIQHYKSVPQKFKQLLILVKGGHNPNLSRLSSDTPGQKELFIHAFEGTEIPTALLKQVRADQDLKWVYTNSKKPAVK